MPKFKIVNLESILTSETSPSYTAINKNALCLIDKKVHFFTNKQLVTPLNFFEDVIDIACIAKQFYPTWFYVLTNKKLYSLQYFLLEKSFKNTLQCELMSSENFRSLVVSGGSYYLLCDTNIIYVMGNNKYGQLGLGTTDNQHTYTALTFFQDKPRIKYLKAAATHVVVVLENDEIYTWGNNKNERTGHVESLKYITRPTQLGYLGKIVKVAINPHTSNFLTAEGSVYSCGSLRNLNSTVKLRLILKDCQNLFCSDHTIFFYNQNQLIHSPLLQFSDPELFSLVSQYKVKSFKSFQNAWVLLTHEDELLYGDSRNTNGGLILNRDLSLPSSVLITTLENHLIQKKISRKQSFGLPCNLYQKMQHKLLDDIDVRVNFRKT